VSTAYTPGLTITDNTLIRKTRRLPLKGTVLVARCDRVAPDTIIARADLPGALTSLRVAQQLGLEPRELRERLRVKEGTTVEKGQLLGEVKALFGLITSRSESPTAGTVEFISEVTGNVGIRHAPTLVELTAYIPGKVTQVQGQIAKFLKPSAFICDPIPGEFDLATGKATLAPEPKIADPKLRSAKLVETSGQNPVKVFDDDPMTVWYIGDGCRRVETLTIRLPKPVTIKSVRVDGRYSYGTQLTVSASLNGKKLPVSSDFNVNRKVDTIVLTLIQRCRQPVTGQVKEVDIIG